MHRCRQYELGGPTVLVKYSKGKQVNKLDLEENGGKISVTGEGQATRRGINFCPTTVIPAQVGIHF
ncbi:hypothetical protein [Neisseria sp. oral taxon 014]|uniref:hypothetical protein n=1 Tax=Neisseria sp. oral taxon 014 TaxID=641148 RepID=UPI0025FCEA0E|nr:hypothetical protein [Neisseria sp. oral taxon 014]